MSSAAASSSTASSSVVSSAAAAAAGIMSSKARLRPYKKGQIARLDQSFTRTTIKKKSEIYTYLRRRMSSIIFVNASRHRTNITKNPLQAVKNHFHWQLRIRNKARGILGTRVFKTKVLPLHNRLNPASNEAGNQAIASQTSMFKLTNSSQQRLDCLNLRS